jgi:membrane protease YdiL (CAAX protease family)
MPAPLTAELPRRDLFITPVARLYLDLIHRHRVIAALLVITSAAVVGQAFWFGKLPQRLAYLAAIAFSVLVLDLLYGRHRPSPLPVRRPGLELTVAAICLLIVFSWLYVHFSSVPTGSPGLVTVLFRLAGLLFAFNIPIALMDLLALRYRLGDLGFRFPVRGLLAVPLILSGFFGLGHLSGAGLTLGEFIHEEGSLWRALPAAIFISSLPEEFFRMTWQTRLGAVTHNAAAAWFLTAAFWAFLHAPEFNAGAATWTPALIGCVNLVPLGLLWGYVLHRTRSLVPSLVLHSFNFSGLQNF